MGNGILSRCRDAPIELGAQERPRLALEYFNGLARACASTEWSAKSPTFLTIQNSAANPDQRNNFA